VNIDIKVLRKIVPRKIVSFEPFFPKKKVNLSCKKRKVVDSIL